MTDGGALDNDGGSNAGVGLGCGALSAVVLACSRLCAGCWGNAVNLLGVGWPEMMTVCTQVLGLSSGCSTAFDGWEGLLGRRERLSVYEARCGCLGERLQ